MTLAPQPVVLTQIDQGDYDGPDPKPLLVVGDLPDPAPDDAGTAALIADDESDTYSAIDFAVGALIASAGSDVYNELQAYATPEAANVLIDDTPADAAAVAADLQNVVDALIAAGLMAEPA